METIYFKYLGLVHAVLLVRVGRAETEDLAHDVFLRAFRALPALQEGRALGAWLAQIARHAALDHLRRRRPWGWLRLGTVRARNPAGLGGEEILAALGELPEAYHEPLAMRLVCGMSGPQIAAALGMTPGSVRVNLCRGMELLRGKLSREALDP